jgi:biotin transport system substrate-specific component
MALYLAWAVAGSPVLAPDPDGGHRTGLDVLLLASATGGYLWGFVVAAAVTGWLAFRGWDRSTLVDLRDAVQVDSDLPVRCA